MNFRSFLLMYLHGRILQIRGKRIEGQRKCYYASKWFFDEEIIKYEVVRLYPVKSKIPRPRPRKRFS